MKLKKIFLIAGTTEGRILADYLRRSKWQAIVSVATSYGEDLIVGSDEVQVRCGRLTQDEMEVLLQREAIEWVIDATHPYATQVTQQIQAVCENLTIPYQRLIRPKSTESWMKCFESTEAVIEFLNQETGKVLLTTGSKDLMQFTKVRDYEKRLYPRILPMIETLQSALALGYQSSKIICMQGPFGYALNKGMLRQIQPRYLVTKDSGDIGGLQDKLKAAKDTGVTVLMIERPKEETGYTLEQIIHLLEEMKV